MLLAGKAPPGQLVELLTRQWLSTTALRNQVPYLKTLWYLGKMHG